jgi:hypothetical protein
MKDVMYRVYCWTSKSSGKSYIGYTGDGVYFRWSKHVLRATTGGKTYFDKAIRKHGVDDWVCKIIFDTHLEHEAKLIEIKMIKELDTLAPNGYNSTPGGSGGNTWFGENVAARKEVLSKSNSGRNNPRAATVIVDDLLVAAIALWKDNGCNWIQSKWFDLCKLKKWPTHLVKWRFSKFGGGLRGLKAAMLDKLKSDGYDISEIKYSATPAHRSKVSKQNLGKIWVTDTAANKSYLAFATELKLDTIIKGRKC